MPTVTVTAEMVAAGDRRNCRFCPVALALNAATGVQWWVVSNAACPNVVRGDLTGAYWRHLPRAVTKWIAAFDAGEPCAPISFEWDYPESLLAVARGAA